MLDLNLHGDDQCIMQMVLFFSILIEHFVLICETYAFLMHVCVNILSRFEFKPLLADVYVTIIKSSLVSMLLIIIFYSLVFVL